MPAQSERLLRYLLAVGEIDAISAWQQLGIYRLSARIYDLRKSGYRIAKESSKVFNRFGEPCLVAKYKFVA